VNPNAARRVVAPIVSNRTNQLSIASAFAPWGGRCAPAPRLVSETSGIKDQKPIFWPA
jgi:hypothetical protein